MARPARPAPGAVPAACPRPAPAKLHPRLTPRRGSRPAVRPLPFRVCGPPRRQHCLAPDRAGTRLPDGRGTVSGCFGGKAWRLDCAEVTAPRAGFGDTTDLSWWLDSQGVCPSCDLTLWTGDVRP